jgi:hypothetical protein
MAEQKLDFENLKDLSKENLEKIKLAKEIADSNKKNSNKFNAFLEKLAFPILLAVMSLLLQYIYTSKIQDVEQKNKIHLDIIMKQNQAHLDSIATKNEAKKDSSIQNQKAADERILDEVKSEHAKSLQALTSALQLKNGLTLEEQDYLHQLKKTQYEDSLAIIDNNRKSNLDYISRQLSEFYWPIYYRLQKNNSVYNMMSNNFIGEKIDTSIILKNHLEILDILQSKFYLAQPDSALADAIANYIKHVSVYSVLRAGNYRSYPDEYKKAYPQDFGANYPNQLFSLIQERTFRLQYTYDTSIGKINVFASHNTPHQIMQSAVKNINEDNKDSNLLDTTISIDKAWSDNNFYDTIDNNLMINFYNFSLDEKYGVFIVEPKNALGNFDKKDWRYVHLRKGDIDWIVINGINYQVQLVDLYATKVFIGKFFNKKRTTALLRIKRWSGNPS